MGYPVRILLALLLLHSLAGGGYAATQNEIMSLLETRYRITKPAFLGGFSEIGSVFVVNREGLRANRPSKIFSPNVIRSQRIESVGGGDIPPGGNIEPDLKIGDRLYLYGIHTGEDFVELELFTVNTFVVTGSGSRGPTPLQASTRFSYDGGVAAVTADQAIDDIHHWFRVEGEAGTTVDGKTGGESGASRTIHLGQTREEVVSILGPPAKIFLLGSKSIFVYPDIKVVFIDGKVTNAE